MSPVLVPCLLMVPSDSPCLPPSPGKARAVSSVSVPCLPMTSSHLGQKEAVPCFPVTPSSGTDRDQSQLCIQNLTCRCQASLVHAVHTLSAPREERVEPCIETQACRVEEASQHPRQSVLARGGTAVVALRGTGGSGLDAAGLDGAGAQCHSCHLGAP